MKHELWKEPSGTQSFILASPHGDAARALLETGSELIWVVEAESHYEAMQRYYEYMGWGRWTTDFPEIDKQTYRERGWE